MQKFVALEIARQLIHSLRPIVEQIARRDSSLAEQLRESGSSILLNIAEGNRRSGRDRLHHFRIAAGSAAESDGALDVGAAWGYVVESELLEARSLIDRQLGLLWGSRTSECEGTEASRFVAGSPRLRYRRWFRRYMSAACRSSSASTGARSSSSR